MLRFRGSCAETYLVTPSADLAEALGIHPCSLSRWIALGMPPEVRTKTPRGFVYDPEAVKAWLTSEGCPAFVTAARVAK